MLGITTKRAAGVRAGYATAGFCAEAVFCARLVVSAAVLTHLS